MKCNLYFFITILLSTFLTAGFNTSFAQKIKVDPSTIPSLGAAASATTEAGFAGAGFSNTPIYYPTSYNQNPLPYTTLNQRPKAYTDPLETITGIFSFFSTLQVVVQRVNPNATNGPLFKGECKNCKNKTKETASSSFAFNRDQKRAVEEGRHDGEEIKAFIAQEDQELFPGLSSDDQKTLTEAIITSLNEYGGLAILNADEFEYLCPNYANLTPNQKKAAVTFAYSGLIKKLSGYDPNLSTPVTVNGKSSQRVGLCQLEYSEVQKVYKNYDEDFRISASDFNSNQATQIVQNIGWCTELLFSSAKDNNTNIGSFDKMLSSVNKDENLGNSQLRKIKNQMKDLNICKGKDKSVGV